MELVHVSLLAAPAGALLAIVAAVRFRSGWSLLLALLGGLIGGLLGRFAWEWFANKAVGIDFGSEFEGYDWVIGFASVGVLFGAVLGSGLAAMRRRLRMRRGGRPKAVETERSGGYEPTA